MINYSELDEEKLINSFYEIKDDVQIHYYKYKKSIFDKMNK